MCGTLSYLLTGICSTLVFAVSSLRSFPVSTSILLSTPKNGFSVVTIFVVCVIILCFSLLNCAKLFTLVEIKSSLLSLSFDLSVVVLAFECSLDGASSFLAVVVTVSILFETCSLILPSISEMLKQQA